MSKSGQAPKEMTERQNWIQDKFNFLQTHIRCKGLSKSSPFKSPAQAASASITSAHNIFRAQPTQVVWRSVYDQTPQYNLQLQTPVHFPEFNIPPTGHGSVCTDENYAVIFPHAKAGIHQNSLQQLSGI